MAPRLYSAGGCAEAGTHPGAPELDRLAFELEVAAGLRIALPTRQAGLLVVRGRAFDAAVLLAMGLALVALATSIPTS